MNERTIERAAGERKTERAKEVWDQCGGTTATFQRPHNCVLEVLTRNKGTTGQQRIKRKQWIKHIKEN